MRSYALLLLFASACDCSGETGVGDPCAADDAPEGCGSACGPEMPCTAPLICTAEGRWYYDVNPKKGTPTRIVACPTTCTQFQQTDMGSVQIKLGCEKTRVK